MVQDDHCNDTNEDYYRDLTIWVENQTREKAAFKGSICDVSAVKKFPREINSWRKVAPNAARQKVYKHSQEPRILTRMEREAEAGGPEDTARSAWWGFKAALRSFNTTLFR